jgi:AraC-like DNA-binding protein
VDPVVDVAARRPAPPLAPFIGRYVGYRLDGFTPGVHRGLPSRHLTFIVSLDEPIELLRAPAPDRGPASLQAFVGGLHTRAALVRAPARQCGVGIELTPFGARALFGLPAAELTREVVELADLLGAGGELPDRLRAAPGWAERFDVLDAVLSRALDPRRRPPAWIAAAWRRFVAADGQLAVEALARELGWSRRHFTECFGREIGLPPRQLARVLRFERARAALAAQDAPPLAALAVQCGYYDQAHLNREWRELAGCTPVEWIAQELPSVQDTAAAPAAGCAA